MNKKEIVKEAVAAKPDAKKKKPMKKPLDP